MRFISVRDLREKSAKIWQELPEAKEIVITSNGRPIAFIAAVNESNLEESIAAFRRARVVEAVAKLQRLSAERGKDNMSMDEIEAEIKTVRQSRPH